MQCLFLLMLCCGAALSAVLQRNMWYNVPPHTWQDAQSYCRDRGAELVTIVTRSDLDHIYMDYSAWIGLRLYNDGWRWRFDNYWVWTNYQDFVKYEPGHEDGCALTSNYLGKAVGDRCENRHFFFCHYWENNERKFHFHPETKSWAQAADACTSSNQRLAAFKNWDSRPSKEKRDFPVWTGLYHDGASWSWSNEEYSGYRNWAPGYGSNHSVGPGLCVAMWSQNKSMSLHNCSEAFPFLCYTNNLVLVRENLTWEEALDHCRSLETVSPYAPHRLLSLEPSELVYANSKATRANTDKVWLGLRFLGGSWFWSNGEPLTLSGLPSCPEPKLRCGALVVDKFSNGSDPAPTIEHCDCSERLNVLCYRL